MKKGFTLVELLVSILLLSLVMTFLSNFIVKLKDERKNTNININLMVNKTAISKAINYDVALLGVDEVTCSSDNLKCIITFKDSTTKTIEISGNNQKNINYYSSDKTYLVRTLNNKDNYFGQIIYSKNILNEGTLYKIVIPIVNENGNNLGYDIEISGYN